MIDDLSRWSLCQVHQDCGSEFGIMEYFKTEGVFGFWFLVWKLEIEVNFVMSKKQERRASQR